MSSSVMGELEDELSAVRVCIDSSSSNIVRIDRSSSFVKYPKNWQAICRKSC